MKSSVSCYAVFYNNRQIKVFTVSGEGGSLQAFNNAKLFADKQAENGYHCEVEEFSMFCRDVGITVYTTNKGTV